MKTRSRKLLAFISLSFATFLAVAQSADWWADKNDHKLPDAFQEYKNLYHRYTNVDTNLYIKGNIRLYDEANGNQLKETMPFCFIRNAGQLYSSLGPLQTFVVDSFAVQLDTVNRRINLSIVSQTPNGLTGVDPAFPFSVNTVDTANSMIRLELQQKNTRRTLKIQNSLNPEIIATTVTYDTLSGRLINGEIRWRNEEVINESESSQKGWLTKMDYQHYSTNGYEVRKLLDKVLLFTNGKPEATNRYKGYGIITMNY